MHEEIQEILMNFNQHRTWTDAVDNAWTVTIQSGCSIMSGDKSRMNHADTEIQIIPKNADINGRETGSAVKNQ